MNNVSGNITVRQGDLFESNAQCLVNTVNTVGVMGKGIALGFKKRFPEMYRDYAARCARHELVLGEPYLYRTLLAPWVINFPTKDHWRSASRMSDIEAGLSFLASNVRDWDVQSIAIPPLGCGEGGLEWRIVGPRIYEHLARLDIPVEMYAPFQTPHEELQVEYLAANASRGAAPPSKVPVAGVALVEMLRRLLVNPYQPPIGRIFFQKVAYFATLAGLPTRLDFRRGSFGPYAKDLKPLSGRLLNNGLIAEAAEGRRIAVRPGTTYERARATYQADLDQHRPVIDKVVDLCSRMTSRQAEVAATVHFAATELSASREGKPVSEVEVFAAVQEWEGQRKPPLSDAEMASAIRNLALLRWLRVEPSPDLPGLYEDPPF